MHLRSAHFIPAHRMEFLAKAQDLRADAFILDLEDGVPADLKAEALANVSRSSASANRSSTVFVRVNLLNSSWSDAEAKFLRTRQDLGLVLPKVREASEIEAALKHFGRYDCRRIILLVEDAVGLGNAANFAGEFQPYGIGLGLEDFLCVNPHQPKHLESLITHLRTTLAVAAMAGNTIAIDTISTDISGGEGFSQECRQALSCGMSGKFTIHPNQIAACNAAFEPEATWAAEAREIASALSDQPAIGYMKWGGKILSPPKLAKAILTAQCTTKVQL